MNPCSEEEYYHKLDNLVLAVCQHVRKVFTNRWRSESGEEWTDDQEQVQKFLKGPGAKVLQKAEPFQKNVLRNKGLEEWDIQLMFLILQNLGRKDKYKEENDAVYHLKELRNYLAHHKNKKIPRPEYETRVADFKGSMKSLGMEDKLVHEIVERMGIASSLKAAEAVAKLYKKANKFQKKGQFDKAMESFSEALDMPSLSPVDRGVAFEKRAECLLSSVQNILGDTDKCDRALLDANKALELNSSSWKAHYLTAKCYHLKNDLPTAQHFYQRALTLSPAEDQAQIKIDYDVCKNSTAVQKREDFLDVRMMPMNFKERLAHLENERGIKMTEEEFISLPVNSGELFEGGDHVFQGHRHSEGWGVPQNHIEAAKCYARAAAVKNPEGMYNLAQCYHHGRGVKQDIQKALGIYQEVAAMDIYTDGKRTPLKCNLSVANSEHLLGLLYEEGIGVDRDYTEAAQWYQKAMEHGVGHAANNLGILYHEGRGRAKDEKMAEYCWKEGVNLKDANAASALVGLYLEQLEPEKAEEMARIGREMDSIVISRISQALYKVRINHVKSMRKKMEPQVLEFERIYKLTTKGLTFKERLERKFRHRDPYPSGASASVRIPKMGVLERKTYLKSPTRKAIILEQRHLLHQMTRDARSGNFGGLTLPPKLRQQAPTRMSSAKPITLGDMNPTAGHIFVNRTLELTIVDEPNPLFASIHLVAEDNNGDVTRLYIYNVQKTTANLDKFQPGCRIAIVNPYMRIGATDACSAIRNDEPRCIVYLEKKENMCRFCGEGNATYQCSKCKRPYCSKSARVWITKCSSTG